MKSALVLSRSTAGAFALVYMDVHDGESHGKARAERESNESNAFGLCKCGQMYLSMVRVIFLPLRLIFLRFLVFPLLLLIQTAAFQAEFAAFHVDLNVLHLISLMIEAGSCRALLCKLRSTTLARIAQCAGFLWTKN